MQYLNRLTKEPTVDELLDDSGVQSLMKSDKVHPEALKSLLKDVQRCLYADQANRFAR